ncbi:2'-5' RNA ligase family protein [Pseudorhodoferax sp.]|uniref:2'-5' RNA ligase family protein n=1 Tax=Pseudorhodoferax sp. TaxID=1993553 RepID=UPI002DD64771|nr:2'-5' RNA ligase family protein [Pseudorhodoferax sp.]
MSQDDLFGDAAPAPAPLERPDPPAPGGRCALFFALQPEAEDAQRLHALADTLLQGAPVYQVAPERLHISLHGLGEHAQVPEHLVEQALRAGQALRFAPIDLAFDRLLSFGAGDRRPVVLDNVRPDPTLRDLYLQLGIALADTGVPVPRRTFAPHLSLWWDERPVAPQAVAPLRWTARRLRLIWSHVGGNRYQRLGDWPLA